MADRILLKPFDQVDSTGLGPGELSIDEVGRKLYLSSDDSSGVQSVPLDVSFVPKPTPEDIELGRVLVMGPTGPRYEALIAGAGGVPLERGPTRWLVPGIIPTDVQNGVTLSSTYTAEFEISEPSRFTEIRICPDGGRDITMTYGVRTLSGEDIYSHQESAYAGPLDVAVEINLTPGRYMFFVTVADALEFQGILGFRPWARLPTFYPIYLRASDAPAQ